MCTGHRAGYLRGMFRMIKRLIMLYALRQSRRRTPPFCLWLES